MVERIHGYIRYNLKNPRKRDHVYIRKVEGKSQYVQKKYLLWKLRDILDTVNGNKIVCF